VAKLYPDQGMRELRRPLSKDMRQITIREPQEAWEYLKGRADAYDMPVERFVRRMLAIGLEHHEGLSRDEIERMMI
jgi:hypothetical protein